MNSNEKELTAMQEFIANAIIAKEHSKDGYVTYDEVIEVATELLTKEREQIIKAGKYFANYNGIDDSDIEDYFTSTYKQ